MNILIVGKKIKNNDWDRINKEQFIGQYYSVDRYFTILNEFIDKNLRKNAKFAFFIISYLMRSSNFKHETSISNGKSIWVWLADIFCWICCLAFIICLFTGVVSPIVQALIKTDFNQAFTEAFKDPTNIALTATALFAFLVAFFYYYMMRFVVAKNKSLNLQDYVFKKIDYIVKISYIIEIQKKFFKTKEDNIVIIEKVDELNNINRWITLQVNNLMFRLFNNFNIILRFENIDKDTFHELNKIMEHDFKNLTPIILNEEYVYENDGNKIKIFVEQDTFIQKMKKSKRKKEKEK